MMSLDMKVATASGVHDLDIEAEQPGTGRAGSVGVVGDAQARRVEDAHVVVTVDGDRIRRLEAGSTVARVAHRRAREAREPLTMPLEQARGALVPDLERHGDRGELVGDGGRRRDAAGLTSVVPHSPALEPCARIVHGEGGRVGQFDRHRVAAAAGVVGTEIVVEHQRCGRRGTRDAGAEYHPASRTRGHRGHGDELGERHVKQRSHYPAFRPPHLGNGKRGPQS